MVSGCTVLTAKHHDGFCLFDTKLTDFKSTNSPCKRDLVREFLEAFREEGIKVGLYFSVIDWRHPDFPHYGDMHHPMRNNPEYSNENRNFDRYLEFMFGQIKELLTNYGKLDLMWFDFSYGEMKCDKWKADQLMEMVCSIQPWIITDNRLEGSAEDAGSIRTLDPMPYSGDFASPEQMIPPAGLRDQGGNLLLNVGPNAKGEIPEESVKILREVGAWMKDNSEIKETFFWNLKEYSENAFFFFEPTAFDCYPLPDEKDTVVEIFLKEEI